ncbi:MAG: ABC transporter permease subunit [Singulisphaera sp.]|nr:ABC transporter permease subunit [Singulisphaera sp.]
MGWLRGLGRGAGIGLWIVVLAPALALAPAAFLDRGPGRSARPTVFPLALVTLDPVVWDCVWNSLTVATVVASGSLVAGVGLARALVRWRFRGRTPLAALALATLVIPPLFEAMGLRRLFELWRGAGAPAAWEHGWGWVGWAWVGLAGGVPLVALASATALARVEPAWEDAARLAGASRLWTWWRLTWPIVRPSAAGAAGVVFTLTLAEPGAPLILGLRRTLGFQIVEAALGPDPAPRAAVLALAAVVLATAARVLLRRWGGRPAAGLSNLPVARTEAARWPRALGLNLMLGSWALLAWLPALVVMSSALAPDPTAPPTVARPSAGAFLRRLSEPPAGRLIANSVALGLAVVAIDLALARALTAGRQGGGLATTAWPVAMPPLALGVGGLALPGLLQMGADALRAAGGREALARGLGVIADGLDPGRTPGVLLVAVAAAARLPMLARAIEAGRQRSRRAPVEAALLLGATAGEARRVASAGWLGATPGALALTLALAATDLAPALVLCPSIESRTMTPGALILADEPGDGRPRAAALASVAIALNVLALALAGSDRHVPLASWCWPRDPSPLSKGSSQG